MLKISNAAYRYGKNTKHVLKDVSFSVHPGECVCILGPNGTGKSTLLKCILHFYPLQSGSIRIDGQDLGSLPVEKRARLLAYVSQSADIVFPYTVREVITMGRTSHMRLGYGASARDGSVVEESMERLGITGMADRYFQTLSGGEKQLVMIARVLAQQAKYLILDEPTSALDYANQIKILQTIQSLTKEGYGILMTSHFPDHALQMSHRALLLSNGIVQKFGSPDDVVTGPNLSELYRAEIDVADVHIERGGDGYEAKVCVPYFRS